MKILVSLTYYRPYTSGLTIYAERLATALVKRGHSVTVLSMQYDKSLPLEEYIEGVHVIRAPVLFKVSKGFISPMLALLALKLCRQHDVIHLHLPQFDAAGLAAIARLMKKPVVITFHCDIKLPCGFINRIVNTVLNTMTNLAGMLASRIVTYTEDYGKNTAYLQRFSSKLEVILPPVELPQISEESKNKFLQDINPDKQFPVIGMAARLAAEKGVEVLLAAMPAVLERFPEAKVLFAGQYQNVIGENVYFEKLHPRISELEEKKHWKFVGVLSPSGMSAFFSTIDALVVPSLNSTESFGLVQIEAMMQGVPVIVSDLPGVRQPVTMSGMGKVVPIGDSESLSREIIAVLENLSQFSSPPQGFFQKFSHDAVAQSYEKLFLCFPRSVQRRK